LRYSRIWTIAVALILVLVFTGLAVYAQTPPGSGPGGGQGRRFFGRPLLGTVTSVSSDSLVLTTWTGRSVTLRTTPTTRAISRQQAGPADLAAGDFVRVIATTAANGSLNARTINDIPASFAMPAAPAPAGGTPPVNGQRGAGRARMRTGLMSGPQGTVMLAGRVAGVANGAITVAMPAGAPISVSVPATARITRLVSPPLASLAPGTHVMVRTEHPRRAQQPGNTTGAAQPPLTAAVIFIVPAGTR
jgi:Domain of unknown function (DUF5666)